MNLTPTDSLEHINESRHPPKEAKNPLLRFRAEQGIFFFLKSQNLSVVS